MTISSSFSTVTSQSQQLAATVGKDAQLALDGYDLVQRRNQEVAGTDGRIAYFEAVDQPRSPHSTECAGDRVRCAVP